MSQNCPCHRYICCQTDQDDPSLHFAAFWHIFINFDKILLISDWAWASLRFGLKISDLLDSPQLLRKWSGYPGKAEMWYAQPKSSSYSRGPGKIQRSAGTSSDNDKQLFKNLTTWNVGKYISQLRPSCITAGCKSTGFFFNRNFLTESVTTSI